MGINTLILSKSGGNEGLGFAVPSNIVRHVVDEIRSHGRVRRGVIGVHVQTITPELAKGLDLPVAAGVVVADVLPGSPADGAGLRVGDVIASMDGKTMENGRQFDVNVYQRAAGAQLRLRVFRRARKVVLLVPVVERPPDAAELVSQLQLKTNLVPELGILAINVSALGDPMKMQLRKSSGVVIAGVSIEAPMVDQPFVVGDVIHAVDGSSVSDLKDLRSALESGASVIQVERKRRLMYISVRVRQP